MDIDAVLQECRALRKIERFSETLRLLDMALNETADARLFYSRAMTFDQMGEEERAIGELTAAIALDETDPKYFFDRGCMLAFPVGKHDEAINDYEQAIRLQPDHVDAHRQCCGSLLIMGRPNRALEHAEKALKLAPNEAGTHFCLGEAFLSLHRYEEAVASLKRAVELDASKDYYISALSRAIEYLDEDNRHQDNGSRE